MLVLFIIKAPCTTQTENVIYLNTQLVSQYWTATTRKLKPVRIIMLTSDNKFEARAYYNTNSDNNKFEANAYYNTEQRQRQIWSQCVL